MEWPETIKAKVLMADCNPHSLLKPCRDLYEGPDQPGRGKGWFQELYLDRRQSDGPGAGGENVQSNALLRTDQENVTAHREYAAGTIHAGGAWETKKRICRYTNRTGGMLDHVAASVLKNRPRIEGPNKYWESLNSDINGAGENFISFLRRLLQEVLVAGRAHIGTVGSKIPFSNRAEAIANQGEDLRLSFLPRTQVTECGDGWFKTFRSIPVRDHPWEESTKTRWLWTYFTATEIAEYEIIKDNKDGAPGPEEEIKKLNQEDHSLGDPPIEPVEILKGLWAMKRLKDPALKLYNLDCAIAYSIWRCSYPVPYMKTHREEITSMSFSEETMPKIQPDEAFDWFGAPSNHFEPAFKERDQARKDHYEVFASMAQHAAALATQNPRQAAAAKSMDREPFTLLLQSIADGLLESVERVLKRIAKFRNEKPDLVKVTGLNNFDGEGENLEQALKEPAKKEPAADPDKTPPQ